MLKISIFRLIYVSNCRLNSDVAYKKIEEIELVSRFKNRDQGITGGLIYCRGRFAGVLEGRRENVESLVDHIQRDPRHEDAATLSAKDHDERIFSDWSLAYSGKSLFIAAIIDRASRGVESDIARLTRAIVEFSDHKQLSGNAIS